MTSIPHVRRVAGHVLPAVLLCLIAGCGRARIGGPAPPPRAPDSEVAADELRPADEVEAPRLEIAILFDNAAPDYAGVAAELRGLLSPERYSLTMVAVDSEDPPQILRALRARPGLFVVAVGLGAARLARDELNVPVVFAQVFNYQELLVDGRPIRGVSAMPPFALQARDWKRLDPGLGRVALIVSERHSYLVGEATEAARAADMTIEPVTSSSDQETLYLFKRLAPEVDGLWLVPDERILSPAVLRELLGYAVSHGVRVSVSSHALLDWGALLSASATTADVARTARSVLERMIVGETDAVPPLTPLSELEVRVNEEVANRLGLGPLPRESWIVRRER